MAAGDRRAGGLVASLPDPKPPAGVLIAGTAVRASPPKRIVLLAAVYFEPRLASPNSQAPAKRLS
jgi:hypothetical protein